MPVALSMLAAAIVFAFYVTVPVTSLVRGTKNRLHERRNGFTPVLASGELEDDGVVYRMVSRTVKAMMAVCNVMAGYLAFWLLALSVKKMLADQSGIAGSIGSGAGTFALWASKMWIDFTIPFTNLSSKIHLFILVGAFVIVLRAIGARAKIRGIFCAVVAGLCLILLNFLLVAIADSFGMPWEKFS